MSVDVEVRNRVGGLVLSGEIGRGLLREIANPQNKLQFSFAEEQTLILLELEEDGESFYCTPNELSVVSEGAEQWLEHSQKAFRIKLSWRGYEVDTALCDLVFKTSDPAITLRRIEFKLPGRVVLSEAAEDDFLMFPKASGMLIPSPAREFFTRTDLKRADWKDRTLSVWTEGFQGAEGALPAQFEFSSDAPMGWLDYYCAGGGIYLGFHDDAFDQTEATVSVERNKSGVCMGLRKTINRHLDEYQTQFAISLHSGDWHRGADIYRAFYDRTGRGVRMLPEFMRKAPGVLCHYDFKWQDGTINHRFADIEPLYDEAVDLGYNQILVAGWNRGGFDNCYPDFTPAPELGSEKELIDSVRAVKAKGGGVFFYINAFSFDKPAPDFMGKGDVWAVKEADGSFHEEVFSTSTLVGMCNAANGWREMVKTNIKYLIDTVGASGVYIDQLNVIPLICHDPTHEHNQSWKNNNLRILEEVRQELGSEYQDKIFLFCEWANDGILPGIDALLIQACWLFGLKYSMPEMFRYTFPEMAVLDMIMQKPWPGTPADLEQQHVKEQFCKMFIRGILFWTYDHVPHTPGFSEFFRKAIALKNRAWHCFCDGRYVDDILFHSCGAGMDAKAFAMPDGGYALCIWNRSGAAGTIRLKSPLAVSRMNILTVEGDSAVRPDALVEEILCPETELSIIILESTACRTN